MQKLRYSILFPFFIVLLSSCKKETLLLYNSKSSIYFSGATATNVTSSVDTLGVSFGYQLPEVTELQLKMAVAVTGIPAGHDRHYTVTLDDGYSAVAGTDFKPLDKSYTLGAGKVTDTFVVTIYRTAAIKTKPVAFRLHLQPNNDFNTDLQSRSDEFNNGPGAPPVSYVTIKVVMDDILVQPKNWYYFGKFDAKKFYLVCQLSGYPPAYFNADYPVYDYQVGRNAGLLLERYLAEQKAAGTPVLYDDGTEMRADD